jgi:predicted  nucleic acid-binding Zn-ribbon protein
MNNKENPAIDEEINKITSTYKIFLNNFNNIFKILKIITPKITQHLPEFEKISANNTKSIIENDNSQFKEFYKNIEELIYGTEVNFDEKISEAENKINEKNEILYKTITEDSLVQKILISENLNKLEEALGYLHTFSKSIENINNYLENSSKNYEDLKLQLLGIDTNLNINLNNKTERLADLIQKIKTEIKNYSNDSSVKIAALLKRNIEENFKTANKTIIGTLSNFAKGYINFLTPILEKNKEQYKQILQQNKKTEEKITNFQENNLTNQKLISEQLDFLYNQVLGIPENIEDINENLLGLQIDFNENFEKIIETLEESFSVDLGIQTEEITSEIKKGNQQIFKEINNKGDEILTELTENRIQNNKFKENLENVNEKNKENFKDLKEKVNHIYEKTGGKKKLTLGRILKNIIIKPVQYAALGIAGAGIFFSTMLLTDPKTSENGKIFYDIISQKISETLETRTNQNYTNNTLLIEEIIKKQTDIERLNSQINIYESEKTKTEEEIQNLEEQIKYFSDKIKELEETLNETDDKREIHNYKILIKDLKSKIDKEKEEKQEIEKEKKKKEEELKKIQEKNQNLEEKANQIAENYEERIKTLKQEAETIKKNYESEKKILEQEKQNLEEQIEETQKEHKTIQKQYETETKKLNENIQKLTEEKTKLEEEIKKSFNETEKKVYKQKITELNSEIEKINTEKKEIEEQKKNLEGKIEVNKQNYEKEKNSLTGQIGKLKKEKTKLEEEIQSYESSLNDYRKYTAKAGYSQQKKDTVFNSMINSLKDEEITQTEKEKISARLLYAYSIKEKTETTIFKDRPYFSIIGEIIKKYQEITEKNKTDTEKDPIQNAEETIKYFEK